MPVANCHTTRYKYLEQMYYLRTTKKPQKWGSLLSFVTLSIVTVGLGSYRGWSSISVAAWLGLQYEFGSLGS